MALHKAFGAFIESDIPLFNSVVTEGATADYVLQTFPDSGLEDRDVKWICQTALQDGSEWLLTARRERYFLMRFAKMADFAILPELRRIDCYPEPSTPTETIGHLFLDQVLPCLLMGRDQLAIHAGAVVIDGEAVAFIGHSGQGKSTLCAGLARKGHRLLSDDCLLLKRRGGRIFCVPSYPGVRLWPESVPVVFPESAVVAPMAHYSSKCRLDAHLNNIPFSAAPAPLRKLYLLAPYPSNGSENGLRIAAVPAFEAFGHLLESSFRLDPHDPDERVDEFNLISLILAKTNVSILSFPRDFSLLPAIYQAIYADLV